MKSLLVNIDVPELQLAVAFYVDGLGFRFVRFLSDEIAELCFSGITVYLLQKPEGSCASSTGGIHRSYGRHWTPVHLDVVADDIEEMMERAVRSGAKVDEPVISHSWGKLAVLSDPFGNGFCLIEFIGRGYEELTAGK
jgi:predicted enzyme related to lactoylglutathione lyase